jgi:CO/xanthine dehydrogenase Mo-binding subunit
MTYVVINLVASTFFVVLLGLLYAALGTVKVLKITAAHDVGRAINPLMLEGQIEGALAQSVGWTLLEHYLQKDGRAVTQHLSTYLIPSVLDVAEVVEPVILEIPDPQGAFGLRGMAEMPYLPLAAAIGNAIHAATGVWIDRFPYTPERVLQALSDAGLALEA